MSYDLQTYAFVHQTDFETTYPVFYHKDSYVVFGSSWQRRRTSRTNASRPHGDPLPFTQAAQNEKLGVHAPANAPEVTSRDTGDLWIHIKHVDFKDHIGGDNHGYSRNRYQ
jgi:hypothetical protein